VGITHADGDHFADAPALAQLNQVPMHVPGDMNQTVSLLGKGRPKDYVQAVGGSVATKVLPLWPGESARF
jgi:hypothetical protein